VLPVTDVDASGADAVAAGFQLQADAIAAALVAQGHVEPQAPKFVRPKPQQQAAPAPSPPAAGGGGKKGGGWGSLFGLLPGAAAAELRRPQAPPAAPRLPRLELRPLEGISHEFDAPYNDYLFYYDDEETAGHPRRGGHGSGAAPAAHGGGGGGSGGDSGADDDADAVLRATLRRGRGGGGGDDDDSSYMEPDDLTDEQDYSDTEGYAAGDAPHQQRMAEQRR
jgi:hypothetical protein